MMVVFWSKSGFNIFGSEPGLTVVFGDIGEAKRGSGH